MMAWLFLVRGSNAASNLVPDVASLNPSKSKAAGICTLSVSADPEEGAYVSGGGRYEVNGNAVHISTSARNTDDYTYTFLYWTQDGVRTPYSRDFWFVPSKGTCHLVAHYQKNEVPFDPDDPAEPSGGNVKLNYYLYLTSNNEGACSFSMASGNKVLEGTELHIKAYPNPNWQFDCWKQNGTVISYSQDLSVTMPASNTTLEACFTEIPYDPDHPAVPTGPDGSTRLLMNFSIGSEGAVADQTRIVVNEAKTVLYDLGTDMAKWLSDAADYQIYSLDAQHNIYSINERPVGDGKVPLGIIVNQLGEVTINASRLDCTAVLVDKYLNCKQDLAIGGYTFLCSAGTFEDRFYIQLPKAFVAGDVNDDGVVDIADAVCIVNYIVGKPNAVFFESAADVNNDDKIDIADAVRIVNYVLGNIPALAPRLDGSLSEPE